jgi:hypothetical protein
MYLKNWMMHVPQKQSEIVRQINTVCVRRDEEKRSLRFPTQDHLMTIFIVNMFIVDVSQ